MSMGSNGNEGGRGHMWKSAPLLVACVDGDHSSELVSAEIGQNICLAVSTLACLHMPFAVSDASLTLLCLPLPPRVLLACTSSRVLSRPPGSGVSSGVLQLLSLWVVVCSHG